MEKANYGKLNVLAAGLGMGLFGVCSIDKEVERFHKDIRERARSLDYAICMGLPLSREIFETITDGPNDIYKTHYRQANAMLDNAAFMLSKNIEAQGFRALPIPASFTVDEKMQTGHLSHKWLAEKAGIGWRGRNNLLVTEKFGSAVRLTTILTDMPLMSNTPVEFGCGDCYDCIAECPAEALGEMPSDYNFDRCYSQILKYSRRNNFGLMICGHCIKACLPKTKRK
jgi:epoxyqueuosine reductase QueG